MADLSESNVRSIVRDEVRDVKQELERVRSSIHALDQRLSELHSIQSDIHRIIPDIQQLVAMVHQMPDERRALGRIQSGLEDVRSRLHTIEKSVAYASAYAIERLKERAERGV